jgi:hypothetical protein
VSMLVTLDIDQILQVLTQYRNCQTERRPSCSVLLNLNDSQIQQVIDRYQKPVPVMVSPSTVQSTAPGAIPKSVAYVAAPGINMAVTASIPLVPPVQVQAAAPAGPKVTVSPVALYYNPSARNNTGGSDMMEILMQRVDRRYQLPLEQKRMLAPLPKPVELLPILGNSANPNNPSVLNHRDKRLTILVYWTESNRLTEDQVDVWRHLNALRPFDPKRTVVVFLRAPNGLPPPPMDYEESQEKANEPVVGQDPHLSLPVGGMGVVQTLTNRLPSSQTFDTFYKFLTAYLSDHPPAKLPVDSSNHIDMSKYGGRACTRTAYGGLAYGRMAYFPSNNRNLQSLAHGGSFIPNRIPQRHPPYPTGLPTVRMMPTTMPRLYKITNIGGAGGLIRDSPFRATIQQRRPSLRTTIRHGRPPFLPVAYHPHSLYHIRQHRPTNYS